MPFTCQKSKIFEHAQKSQLYKQILAISDILRTDNYCSIDLVREYSSFLHPHE